MLRWRNAGMPGKETESKKPPGRGFFAPGRRTVVGRIFYCLTLCQGATPWQRECDYPFTLPAVSPCTKNFWQVMNTMITGTSVSTDMANTYPHWVN